MPLANFEMPSSLPEQCLLHLLWSVCPKMVSKFTDFVSPSSAWIFYIRSLTTFFSARYRGCGVPCLQTTIDCDAEGFRMKWNMKWQHSNVEAQLSWHCSPEIFLRGWLLIVSPHACSFCYWKKANVKGGSEALMGVALPIAWCTMNPLLE